MNWEGEIYDKNWFALHRFGVSSILWSPCMIKTVSPILAYKLVGCNWGQNTYRFIFHRCRMLVRFCSVSPLLSDIDAT